MDARDIDDRIRSIEFMNVTLRFACGYCTSLTAHVCARPASCTPMIPEPHLLSLESAGALGVGLARPRRSLAIATIIAQLPRPTKPHPEIFEVPAEQRMHWCAQEVGTYQ